MAALLSWMYQDPAEIGDRLISLRDRLAAAEKEQKERDRRRKARKIRKLTKLAKAGAFKDKPYER
ncbi:MAG: hypothetical protein KA806_08650 [Sulfuritalea sp.]|jgi:hypothetical protein|nr:hypothetical protein [Sulfuritalea sp.]